MPSARYGDRPEHERSSAPRRTRPSATSADDQFTSSAVDGSSPSRRIAAGCRSPWHTTGRPGGGGVGVEPGPLGGELGRDARPSASVSSSDGQRIRPTGRRTAHPRWGRGAARRAPRPSPAAAVGWPSGAGPGSPSRTATGPGPAPPHFGRPRSTTPSDARHRVRSGTARNSCQAASRAAAADDVTRTTTGASHGASRRRVRGGSAYAPRPNAAGPSARAARPGPPAARGRPRRLGRGRAGGRRVLVGR